MSRGFPGGSVVKNLPANAGDVGSMWVQSLGQEDALGKGMTTHSRRCGFNVGSIPGSGRCPGEGNDNPLQYPCLEKPMDRGAWPA